MKKHFSLKDHLFNPETVRYLADLFATHDAHFDADAFTREVMAELPSRELKERIVWIAQVLERFLSKDFKIACRQIVQALPEPLDPHKTDNDFGSFIFAPLGVFVVRNGQSNAHVHTSLETLHEITKRFSMEDSIRYFINAFEKETLETLETWAHDDHYHVRRLVSEGTRPRLPWSGRLTINYTKPIAFLDVLYADTTRYVTRSVANHLNDIAKTDPSLVVETLTRWQAQRKQTDVEMEWIMRHALRTLIKSGDTNALQLLGYTHVLKPTEVSCKIEKTTQKITQGESLIFTCELVAQEDAKLMVDYEIGFVKANGQRKGRIFKLKKLSVKKGEKVTLIKRHRLMKDATTFTLYPGLHTLTLQINGHPQKTQTFTVQ